MNFKTKEEIESSLMMTKLARKLIELFPEAMPGDLYDPTICRNHDGEEIALALDFNLVDQNSKKEVAKMCLAGFNSIPILEINIMNKPEIEILLFRYKDEKWQKVDNEQKLMTELANRLRTEVANSSLPDDIKQDFLEDIKDIHVI